jgi:hypothetical protein
MIGVCDNSFSALKVKKEKKLKREREREREIKRLTHKEERTHQKYGDRQTKNKHR